MGKKPYGWVAYEEMVFIILDVYIDMDYYIDTNINFGR